MGEGSCLRYYAYRKMIAVKMVFARFLATKNKFTAALRVLRHG